MWKKMAIGPEAERLIRLSDDFLLTLSKINNRRVDSIKRMLREKSQRLTTPDNLAAIREFTGMKDDQILVHAESLQRQTA